jgi:sugar phosphate isomerase/epimerase
MSTYILSAFADEASKEIGGQIAALKRNKIKNIELRNIDSKNIFKFNEAEAHELKKLLDENDIRVPSIGSPIGKVSLDCDFPKYLESCKRFLNIANIMNSKMIRVFSFFPPEGVSIDDCLDEVVDKLGAIIELAESAGILCCHENEKGIYGDLGRRCVKLYSAFDGRLGGIFDPANYVQCKELPSLIYNNLEKYITYFHIKDALLKTGQVVPSGEGDGAIPELLVKYNLFRKAKSILLTVEPHLKVFAGLENLHDDTSVNQAFVYNSNDESFDAAVNALKKILERCKFSYE